MLNKEDTRLEKRIKIGRNANIDILRSLSDRKIMWISSYLEYNGYRTFNDLEADSLQSSFISRMRTIEKYDDLIKEALSEMEKERITDIDFAWLEGNVRAQLFFLRYFLLKKYEHTNFFPNKKKSLIRRVYRNFSYANSCEENMRILRASEKAYLYLLKNDDYTKWLDSKDVNKIYWTQEYLKKNDFYIDSSLGDIAINTWVLASLDAIDIKTYIRYHRNFERGQLPTLEKMNLINKMKRAWSQQKYRDAGKTKTQYHLALTKQTKKRLSKMAEVKGLSETALLDILINSEYQLKFLDSDGKDIY